MARTIDHAAAASSSWEVTAGRATCTCGWKGPLRETEVDARADRDRHQAGHEAHVAGYRFIGPSGANSIGEHAHGGPPPTDDPPLGVPVSLHVEQGRDPWWTHRHDGGALPHTHAG